MQHDLQLITHSLPLGSLDAYIERINRIAVLSREEEQRLAQQFYFEQDLQAARHLVLANLRYVVRIARGYLSYGLAFADLIQEGNIGLMKAVKRFNPAVGVRLLTFALHWIKAEIQEFILRNWRIVKVATTKAQRKLFFNLRKTKERLGWFNQAEVNSLAKDLGVAPATVREMETRMSARDASLENHDEHDDDNTFLPVAPIGYLSDQRYEPVRQLELHDQQEVTENKLQNALVNLDARSQHIIQQRWLAEPKATLQELADHYQISAERVRQLEQNAMKKLRTELENE